MTDRSPAFRRHDLDALRAVAMLLGIALHASLAYVPGIPWPVQDAHPAPWLGLLFLAIHGFRMPLFFLLSGFFTALLWQRRGAAAMLAQRYQRVFVPLVLGSVTLLPLFARLALDGQGALAPAAARPEEPPVVRAIRAHDADAVAAALAAGADASAFDAEFGMPPIWFAAIEGDAAAARLLLAAGADPGAIGADGRSPLHAAAFTGRADVVQVLLDAGAEPLPRSPAGDTPLDSTNVDAGTTALIAGALRVRLDDPDALEQGRAGVRALLAERAGVTPTAPSAPRTPRFLDPFRDAYRAWLLDPRWTVPLPPRGERQSLLLSDAFGYLWFLWFLVWFALAFAALAGVGRRLRLPLPPRRLVASPLALSWLVPLTLLPQAFMGLFTPVFGPDTSTSLLPQPHILAYYFTFFAYGALLQLGGEADDGVGRHWALGLAAAILVCFPVGVATMSDPLATTLPQVLYAWLMCFAAIGLFRRLVPHQSAAWRYLSDSAYWLYLVHMPLLVVLQRAIAPWNLPGTVKFLLACGAATAILLVSYQLLVRHTPLGTLLNGPRGQRPSRAASNASS